ncbi:MAG: RND transporter [Planctomycetes bacterium]|nr:RND transporter [Planctomycetota bacterium]
MKLYRTLAGALLVVGVSLTGCGEPAKAPPAAEAHDHDHAHDHGHSHEAWWCSEHGVPEHLCGLCSPKLAEEMKKKKDWCTKHDRPDSQCFICHPEFEDHFIALYEAKYGKKPPKAESHDHKDTKAEPHDHKEESKK